MAEGLPWDFEGRGDRLYIHFDVKEHYLSLDTFIKTADSARRVMDALDKTFFDGELKGNFIVLPPKNGTFLTEIALWISGGATAFFAFVNSDVGAAFVEGLTGKSPAVWAKQAGEGLREIARDTDTASDLGAHDAELGTTYEEPQSFHGAGAIKVVAGVVIVAMVSGILAKETDALTKIGMEAGHLPDAMDARAEFYLACIEDSDVAGIGFTPEDEFPIHRSSFPERAQKTARKEKEEDEPEWLVSTESIYVNSPNWNQDKQNTRKWQGVDSGRHDCLFVIEDAEFWQRLKKKKLHFEGLDSLKVQWAFQLIGGKAKNRRVLRVLEFNGQKLADALTPDALGAILGSFSKAEASRNGPTLFDFGDDDADN